MAALHIDHMDVNGLKSYQTPLNCTDISQEDAVFDGSEKKPRLAYVDGDDVHRSTMISESGSSSRPIFGD